MLAEGHGLMLCERRFSRSVCRSGWWARMRGAMVATRVGFLLVMMASIAEGSHFRYGTVRWSPTQRTINGGVYEAEFRLQLAYRKNYAWGTTFKEAWRDTSDPIIGTDWQMALAIDPFDCSSGCNDYVQCFDTNCENFNLESNSYQVRFPTGMGDAGYDLVPNNDGQETYIYPASGGAATGKIINSAADQENTGGRVCKCRFHKGVDATDESCPEITTHLGGGVVTTETNQGNDNDAGYMLPKYMLGVIDTNNTELKIQTCTPWSEVFGFFFGDDTEEKYWADEVVVDVVDIDHDDSLQGNYFRGTSLPVTHEYANANYEGRPYTAFFTGGNRIGTLNNNAFGRFRLEVNVMFRDGANIINRSPVGAQIPVLPVPYGGNTGTKFQVLAYDPDNDVVRFFLGSQTEQGGLLANPTMGANGFFTYHRDVYRNSICKDLTGSVEMCSRLLSVASPPGLNSTEINRLKSTENSAGGNGFMELMPDWNDAVNLPHAPPGLTIDYESGIVTWMNGIDITTADADGNQAAAGFYNLVVMVEERKFGLSADIAETRDLDAIKIPIDFLLYLYPQVHFCNMDCAVGDEDDANIVQTFESTSGYYGHYATGGVYPKSGAGRCKICGGGGIYDTETLIGKEERTVNYTSVGSLGTSFCNVPTIRSARDSADGTEACCTADGTPGTYVEYGLVNDMTWDRDAEDQTGFQGCLGYGPQDLEDNRIVPYSGKFDTCNVNTAPFFLTSSTTPRGETPEMDSAVEPFRPAVVEYEKGETVTFTLQAMDPDACSEISIMDTGMQPGMQLSAAERIDDIGDDAMHSVTRTVTWPAYMYDGEGNMVTTDESSFDMRDQYSVTCFYATDQYLLTSYPYHCVQVNLIDTTVVTWANDTDVDGGFIDGFLGMETCINLKVEKRPAECETCTSYNIDVVRVTSDERIDGVRYPRDDTFDALAGETKFLTINFPASGYWADEQNPLNLRDPFTKPYCVTPQDGEECAFTMCFRGVDSNTLDSPNPEYTSTVRCYMLYVWNNVLTFEDGDSASAEEVSSLVAGDHGYSVSVWVLVNELLTPGNQTIVSFGSSRARPSAVGPPDTGLSVLSSIFWTADSIDGIGAFGYYDDTIGSNFTAPVFAVKQWHCITVTVTASGEGKLYVDGGLASFDSAESIDETITRSVTFHTKARLDNEVWYDPTDVAMASPNYYGTMMLGGNFRGTLDEVRVWDKTLTAAEVDANIYTRAPTMGVDGLVALLTMTPETSSPMPALSEDRLRVKLEYTGMTPCTLGLSQQVVGPTAGGCPILVEAHGVSLFSPKVSCKFGDRIVRGTVEGMTVLCESPGVMTPGYTPVLLSNDGATFTNPFQVGKQVDHLFMESSFYGDGSDGSGIDIDGVCAPMLEREAEGERAVTFGGWFCPDCGPPLE